MGGSGGSGGSAGEEKCPWPEFGPIAFCSRLRTGTGDPCLTDSPHDPNEYSGYCRGTLRGTVTAIGDGRPGLGGCLPSNDGRQDPRGWLEVTDPEGNSLFVEVTFPSFRHPVATGDEVTVDVLRSWSDYPWYDHATLVLSQGDKVRLSVDEGGASSRDFDVFFRLGKAECSESEPDDYGCIWTSRALLVTDGATTYEIPFRSTSHVNGLYVDNGTSHSTADAGWCETTGGSLSAAAVRP